MSDSITARFERFSARVVARPKFLFLAAALFGAVQISPWWYATPDSTCYLSIARSMWSPDGPTNLGRSQLFFSIGYPLLIAPTFLLDDRPFLWIAVIHWLLTLALMAGVYRWAKPLGPVVALVATIVTVVHALYGNLARRPLSEPFFMTTMVWAALTLDTLRTSTESRKRILAGIVGTLLLTLACLIRPNGVMLIPGFGMAMLASAWGDRRRVVAALGIAALVGSIAAGVFFASRAIDDRRASGEKPFTYWDQMQKFQDPGKSMLGRVPGGLVVQMYDFQRVIVPGNFKSRTRSTDPVNVNLPVALAATVLVAVGWWMLVRKRGDVWTWTFPFYIALNALWAADAGTRYTVPVMPVVLAAFWLGQPYLKHAAWWVLTFIVLHTAVGIGFWAVGDLPRNYQRNQHWDSVGRLTAMVDRDRDSLGAWSLSPEQLQFFRFVLDREVLPYSPVAASPEGGPTVATTSSADRLFSLDDAAPPPGYEKLAEDGPYALLRRTK